MKKIKHWKVSVFDKTSETIRDDTFYTTDTEAYLIFELIDEDFTPDSATVTVYNVYGKATINASVEIADGIVQYEMPVDAIGHPGGWRTQVIYTKDNEDYTTKIIEFDVGGHLLDNKKPAIVDIENWNSFIEHAGELIDDWEQLEEIRQTNERQRELAESARQTEFETNETSRQTNELVREEAELARESAESVRVANEAERITKDSERDNKIEAVEGIVEDVNSELDNKADVSALELYAKKEQEDWITPTLMNGWTTPTGTYQALSFMKDDFGFVHLRGHALDGADSQIFVLPTGYRPNRVTLFPIYTAFGPLPIMDRVTISSNGQVSVAGYGDGRQRPLNGIYFKAGE